MKPKYVECPDCQGTGYVEGQDEGVTVCDRCDGQGKIGADELPEPPQAA